MKTILGLDPGLATVGWALLEGQTETATAAGMIRTTPDIQTTDRLFLIKRSLLKVLQEYNPTEIAIEDFIFQMRPKEIGYTVKGEKITEQKALKNSEGVNRALGVIIVTCREQGFTINLYPAPEIKEAIAGRKNAGKREVTRSLSLRIKGMEHLRNEHTRDAAAVALYHRDKSRFEELVKG